MFEDFSHLNLISLLGLGVMLTLAWTMSSHRDRINWQLVFMGVGIQLALAALFFNSQKWTFNGQFEKGIVFATFDSFFQQVIKWTNEGASFVFQANGLEKGDTTNPVILLKTFTFGVLPTVIFFASLMSVLYYLGVMRKIVGAMAWLMQRTLGTSGSESLAAAANIFVGHTEAPLVVKPFIPTMTRSELNAMMVGGFATITGGLMAIFVAEGVSAGHLVTASIVSAPAALVIAKILQPETEKSDSAGEIQLKIENSAVNVIDAAAQGASDGLKLALNIAAMLIAFLALLAMLNSILFIAGEALQAILNAAGFVDLDFNWSLTAGLSYLFAPLAWCMGIENRECLIAGELLGTKMAVNEFVAYLNLGDILKGNRMVPNADGVPEPVELSERTTVILTYALCGFSNFGAIGIQLGGIGPLAPERKSELAQLGLRAMLGGTLACCMTACIAGFFYGII